MIKKNKIWIISAIILGLIIGWNMQGRLKKVHLEKILTPNKKQAQKIYEKLSPYGQLNLEIIVQHYCRCSRILLLKDSSLIQQPLQLDQEILDCMEYEMSTLAESLDKDLQTSYDLNEEELKLYRTALIMNRMHQQEDCAAQHTAIQKIVDHLHLVENP